MIERIGERFSINAVVLYVTAFAMTVAPLSAQALTVVSPSSQGISAFNDVTKVVIVRRRGIAVGPRGGIVARRSTIVRPGWRGAGTRWVRPVPGPRPVRPLPPGPLPGAWVRPGWYGWPVGGAIAAGAAVGFVTAAAATAWATSPAPAPGMCWYYTDPSKTKGFWDYCPR